MIPWGLCTGDKSHLVSRAKLARQWMDTNPTQWGKYVQHTNSQHAIKEFDKIIRPRSYNLDCRMNSSAVKSLDGHLIRQWILRWSWSITCRHCSTTIFIINLASSGLDNCQMRRETFKFYNLLRRVWEIWWYWQISFVTWAWTINFATCFQEEVLIKQYLTSMEFEQALLLLTLISCRAKRKAITVCKAGTNRTLFSVWLEEPHLRGAGFRDWHANTPLCDQRYLVIHGYFCHSATFLAECCHNSW